MQLSPAVIQDIGAYCLKRYLEEKSAADTLTGSRSKKKQPAPTSITASANILVLKLRTSGQE
jgi:hypothetical protein